MQRLRQLAQTFAATRSRDPGLVPAIAAWSGGILAVIVVLGIVLRRPILFTAFAVLAALLAALVILGRRAERAALVQLEGQPGAAAAVLQSMRGPWIVTPAIAFNRRQDLVHLVVGRPGAVLVAEGGTSARTQQILQGAKRKVARAAGEVPVHEVVVGDGDGEVPLGRLALTLARLPRTLKPKEVGPLSRKLQAVTAAEPPLPKGPMPRVSRKYR